MAFSPSKENTGKPGTIWVELQILTRNNGSLTAADGVPLDGIGAVEVMVEANATKTLTTCPLIAYLYDPRTAVGWFRAPHLDQTMTTAGAGNRGWLGVPVNCAGSATGTRLLYATNGVTVSGGTDVNVYIRDFPDAKLLED